MNGSFLLPSDGLGILESFSLYPLPSEPARSVSSSAGYAPCNHTRPQVPGPGGNHTPYPATCFVARPPSGWDGPREYFPAWSRPTSCPAYWHHLPRLPEAHLPHRSGSSVSCPVWPDRWGFSQSP